MRQDRGREADPLIAIPSAVTDPWLAFNGANPCLDLALGQMAVASQTAASVRQGEILMAGQENRNLRFHSLREEQPRSFAENFRQRINNLIWLNKGDNVIPLYGI